MFTINDYWMIFQYLMGQSVPNLDTTLKILADSERTTATKLFETVIDQVCFNSSDYKRTRKFLIDWYSSFRTLSSIQKSTHDPFALPQTYLNELLRSFGFKYPSIILSQTSKVDFFLDLVNLYKIKGTPLAIKSAIEYYGLRDTDVTEYWLQKNETGELVLRGTSVFPKDKLIDWPDVRFEETTILDPHWMQTKADIERLVKQNVIALPSKTPYFGLRPAFNLSDVQIVLSVLVRTVEDQFATWWNDGLQNGSLPRNVKISSLNYTCSLLELYLSSVYTFNNYFHCQYASDSTSDLYICYNGDLTSNSDITKEYINLTKYPVWNPDDPVGEKSYRESLVQQFNDDFTRARPRNFIQDASSAGEWLAKINPSLKNSIDSWTLGGEQFVLLASLLQDLTGWMKSNVGSQFSDLIAIVLGVESFLDIRQLVNVFKPYRARLVGIQFAYVINNPTFDSLRFYDPIFYIKNILPFYDWDTANSLPCCASPLLECSDSTSVIEPVLYSRETYDCGSYFDMGIASDWAGETEQLQQVLIQQKYSSLNCHYVDSTSTLDIQTDIDYETGDVEVSTDDYWCQGNVDPVTGYADGTTDPITGGIDGGILVSGGFLNFDVGTLFDCPGGNDLVQIYTVPIPM